MFDALSVGNGFMPFPSFLGGQESLGWPGKMDRHTFSVGRLFALSGVLDRPAQTGISVVLVDRFEDANLLVWFFSPIGERGLSIF